MTISWALRYSVSGRSTIIQHDATGDGVFEQIEHGDVVVAADGSATDTVTHLNGDGSLHDRTVVTVSRDAFGRAVLRFDSPFSPTGFWVSAS